MKEYRWIAGLFLIFMPFSHAGYTWHSTNYEFQQLLKTDLKALKNVERDLKAHAVELRMVKSAVEMVKKKLDDRLSDAERAFLHPISYLRFHDPLKETQNAPKLEQNIEPDYRTGEIFFPGKSDREAVLRNLYSLQISHNFMAHDLARGIIGGYKGSKMEPDDCIEMANIASKAGDNGRLVSWASEALRKISEGEESNLSEAQISEVIKAVEDEMTCRRLCAEGREIIHKRKELKCFMWDNRRDPWLVLQPVKMEVLDNDPHIYRFYNVVSDDEIRRLKSLFENRLKEAKTQGDHGVPVKLDSARVAHHHFISERNKVVARLDHVVSHITGLDLRESEELQIATYGIAGHYVPHYDEANSTLKRTATFMFYLSDIEQGGATVFVRPEIAVMPQKGSAIMWYNILPSGYVDPKSKHCACQVIVGTKWIMNKWIRAEHMNVCRKNLI